MNASIFLPWILTDLSENVAEVITLPLIILHVWHILFTQFCVISYQILHVLAHSKSAELWLFLYTLNVASFRGLTVRSRLHFLGEGRLAWMDAGRRLSWSVP